MAVMKDDASPRGAARSRLRAALVVSQVAVSVLLLVGAGLVARSLDAAEQADAGFDADHVISMSLDLGPNGTTNAAAACSTSACWTPARADAGVESATLAMTYPMTMVDGPGQPVAVEGYEPRQDEDLSFLFNVVAPDYFRTLRIGASGRPRVRPSGRS